MLFDYSQVSYNQSRVCVGFVSAAGDVLEKKYTTRYLLKRTKCVYIDIDPVVCQLLGN